MCGAVSFSARRIDPDFGACHCGMCQRWAGSALLAVSVDAEEVSWEGSEHVGRIQSSDWAERAWCNRCGSGLWYRITAEGSHKGQYHIPVGLFDDQQGLTLTREIFVDHRSAAFAFSGDHQEMTEAQVFALYGPTT